MFDTIFLILGLASAATGLALAAWAIRGDRPHGRRRCPRCWYNMTALASLTCPECGREAASERDLTRRRPRRGALRTAIAVLILGPLAAWLPILVRDGWHALPDPILGLLLSQFDGQAAKAFDAHMLTSGPPAVGASQWDRLLIARRCAVLLTREHLPALDHHEWSHRVRVDSALGAIDPPDRRIVVPALRRLVSAPDVPAAQRRRALRLMQSVAPPPTFARALVQALQDPDHAVRREAIEQLPGSIIPARQAVPLLLPIINNDPSSDLRARGVRSIGTFLREAPELQDLLERLARQDASESVRTAAVDALGGRDRTGAPLRPFPGIGTSAGMLARLARDWPVEERLQWTTAHEGQDLDDETLAFVVESLIAFMQDPEPQVRLAAIQAIARLGPRAESARTALHYLRQHDDDPVNRRAAADALPAISPVHPGILRRLRR